MGIYLNPSNDKFQRSLNSKISIDKSELIAYTNEVIQTNQEVINKRIGEELDIKYILDLREFPGSPIEHLVIHDFEQIVNDDEVKIVVEVMGGIEPAYTFVKTMLEAGKHVTTSNKALVADKGAELIALAKEKNVKAKILIGGAVITQDYCDEIGADGYSKDASEAVKCAERLLGLAL